MTPEQISEHLHRSTLDEALIYQAVQQVQFRRDKEGRGNAPWSDDDLEEAQQMLNDMVDEETADQLMRD